MKGSAAVLIAASVALSGCNLVFGVDGSTHADDVVDPDARAPIDFASGACEPALVTDGLTAWYSMKELEGGTLPACVGTPGTCNPGACPDEDPNGVYGSALRFSVGRYIQVDDAPLPSGRSLEMTAAFWMRVDQPPGDVCPVRKLIDNGTTQAWSLCLHSSSDLTVTATARWTDAVTHAYVAIDHLGVAAGTWMHVAMRSDGMKVELFPSGVNAGIMPINGLVDAASVLRLGSDTDATQDTSFDGALADVRIYDRLLNDLEIKQLGFLPP